MAVMLLDSLVAFGFLVIGGMATVEMARMEQPMTMIPFAVGCCVGAGIAFAIKALILDRRWER